MVSTNFLVDLVLFHVFYVLVDTVVIFNDFLFIKILQNGKSVTVNLQNLTCSRLNSPKTSIHVIKQPSCTTKAG